MSIFAVSHVDTEVSFRMALLNESYLKLILPGRDAVKKSICDKVSSYLLLIMRSKYFREIKTKRVRSNA